MSIYELVEEDIASVYVRWADRGAEYFERSRSEYERVVDPAAYYRQDPDMSELEAVNLSYTEWFLFEFGMRGGKSPVECYVDDPPSDATRAQLGRLRQVADTQFFSRFGIEGKRRDEGDVELVDLMGGGGYVAHVPVACHRRSWRTGSLAVRIARVDGHWMQVGGMLLYDRSPSRRAAGAGPGEFHEDVGVELGPDGWSLTERERSESYYLNFLHDVMGLGGAFTDTFRCVA